MLDDPIVYAPRLGFLVGRSQRRLRSSHGIQRRRALATVQLLTQAMPIIPGRQVQVIVSQRMQAVTTPIRSLRLG